MKKCSTCQEEKEESEFSFKSKIKGIKHSHCKSCQSNKVKKHYIKNKDKYKQKALKNNFLYASRNQNFANEYKKQLGCRICPEKESCALDFHHINPHDKEKTVSVMIHSAHSIDSLMKEIRKCVVLCSNCHRKLHAGLLTLP